MRTSTSGWLPIIGASLVLVACTPDEQPAAEIQAPAAAATDRSAPDATDGTEHGTRQVVAERLPYAEVDDKLVYGHFAIPADMIDPLPAVIVVHDRWGLDQEMQQITERLAAAGYIALGVDLFDGKIADTPAGARELELGVVQDPELAIDNLAGAHDFIRNTAGAPRTAIIGYGFGGGWSLTAALELSGALSASAMYYGQVTDDAERLEMLDVPLLGLFAQGDRAVPVASVEKFRTALESLEKDVEIRIYTEARRGFADRRSDNYDPDISADAWNRVLEFLEPRMAEGDE